MMRFCILMGPQTETGLLATLPLLQARSPKEVACNEQLRRNAGLVAVKLEFYSAEVITQTCCNES